MNISYILFQHVVVVDLGSSAVRAGILGQQSKNILTWIIIYFWWSFKDQWYGFECVRLYWIFDADKILCICCMLAHHFTHRPLLKSNSLLTSSHYCQYHKVSLVPLHSRIHMLSFTCTHKHLYLYTCTWGSITLGF